MKGVHIMPKHYRFHESLANALERVARLSKNDAVEYIALAEGPGEGWTVSYYAPGAIIDTIV